MFLVRTDEPRMRQSVALCKLAFALLTAMALQAWAPAPWASGALKYAICLAALGVAVLGWAFRQLNGRRTDPAWGVTAILLLSIVTFWGATLDGRAFVTTFAATFLLISTAITVDQGLLVQQRVKVRPAEVSLLIVAGLFALGWLAILHHSITSQEPIPTHWLYAPRALLPICAIAFAALPLTVAAVAMVIINDRLMQALRARSITDELTGLLSRRGLRERGEKMLAARAAAPHLMAVLMLDIDYFKAINDRYGHQVGDEVLRHVATVAKNHLRGDSILARYGGEEFTALVPLRGAEEALVVAERLRHAVERHPCVSKKGPVGVTVSVGVAYCRVDESLESVLGRADKHLYEAKQSGRNRTVAAPL